MDSATPEEGSKLADGDEPRFDARADEDSPRLEDATGSGTVTTSAAVVDVAAPEDVAELVVEDSTAKPNPRCVMDS